MSTIKYYWRPGCPFCMRLEQALDEIALPLDKRNIWDSKKHAATVRSVADGNETVPTVVIGDFAMVNPSPAQVIAAVAEHAPDELPEGVEVPEEGRVGGFIRRALGG